MKLRKHFYLVIFCALLFGSHSVKAQIGIVDKDAKTKPTLMVLGSYHFANPGRDVVKTKVTDVSTPERQKQILEMIQRLEKYKPTKIVLECDAENQDKVQEKFAKYLKGEYQLSINESEQIGFRLAKDLADKKIYCVDNMSGSPGNPSDYDYAEFAAKDKGLDVFLKETWKKLQDDGNRRDELFQKIFITEQFIYLNEPVQIENDHSNYFYSTRLGKGSDYIGDNWLSSWYGRNLKIFSNIIRITNSPNDGILAICGARHLKLLNQLVAESRFYNVQSPLKYLKQ